MTKNAYFSKCVSIRIFKHGVPQIIPGSAAISNYPTPYFHILAFPLIILLIFSIWGCQEPNAREYRHQLEKRILEPNLYRNPATEKIEIKSGTRKTMPPGPITLDQAIATALENNPKLKSVQRRKCRNSKNAWV